jgi:hypothetical protein
MPTESIRRRDAMPGRLGDQNRPGDRIVTAGHLRDRRRTGDRIVTAGHLRDRKRTVDPIATAVHLPDLKRPVDPIATVGHLPDRRLREDRIATAGRRRDHQWKLARAAAQEHPSRLRPDAVLSVMPTAAVALPQAGLPDRFPIAGSSPALRKNGSRNRWTMPSERPRN